MNSDYQPLTGFRPRSGKVVILEGLIAAGKSTFAEELAISLGPDTLLLLEPDEQEGKNPYLQLYYQSPDDWAFHMQIHLLSTRFRMHLRAQWRAMNTGNHVVMDRSYFGDTAFARLQLRRRHLSPLEFETYGSTYQAMTASVLLPQVCVWLRTDPETSLERINKRIENREGRACESSIDLGYLRELNEEIGWMINALRGQGVMILELDWDEERSQEERLPHVLGTREKILSYNPADPFLDLHRRTL